MNDILTDETITLQQKGVYAILKAYGRMNVEELSLYTTEDIDTLYDVLESCINLGIVKIKDGYCFV